MTDAIYTQIKAPRSGRLSRFAQGFKRFAARMAEARELEARRQVAHYLAAMDDASLKELGFSRKDVQRWS